jgi:hypothetical protein
MKPAGLVTKTKDNSRKKHRENAEWIKGKKIGRPKQQWVPAEIVSRDGWQVPAHWEKI